MKTLLAIALIAISISPAAAERRPENRNHNNEQVSRAPGRRLETAGRLAEIGINAGTTIWIVRDTNRTNERINDRQMGSVDRQIEANERMNGNNNDTAIVLAQIYTAGRAQEVSANTGTSSCGTANGTTVCGQTTAPPPRRADCSGGPCR